MLTWREVVVLEDAYISSQRNHLENVANALDKHLQYNVDKLIFLRNGMREALVAPLDFTSLRDAVTEFEQHRDEHAWQIELNRRRTLSVNGVSDALVSEGISCLAKMKTSTMKLPLHWKLVTCCDWHTTPRRW